MSKSVFSVSVDLSGLLNANAKIAQAILPTVSKTVAAVAEAGAHAWKFSVWKARLWEGYKKPYVESITWKMTGPFAAEIWADYPKAGEIERGMPGRDLKVMLQTSKKTRVVHSGKHAGQRYLIIPFRHNIPTPSGQGALAAQMPQHVYALAKTLAPSKILPPGAKKPAFRLSASGHLVPQHSYQWGGRLPEGLAPKKAPHHVTDPYAGMVRFKTAPTGSSAYLTFRTMGEWSSGWVVAPRPGLKLAEGVAKNLQPALDQAVAAALKHDLNFS